MTKILFEIDKEKDKAWVKNSLKIRGRYKRSGFDIFKSSVMYFPELLQLQNLPEQKWDGLIDKVLDSFYKKLLNKLKHSKIKIEKDWRRIEQDYFKEASKLFDDHPWPKGNYNAVLSVLNGYPRYLSKKEFHIPWKVSTKDFIKKINALTPNNVIVHETLHFLFFDYWNKHFKGQLSKGLVWDLSEIIDVLIQNKEPFFSFCDKVKRAPCPGHIDQYNVIKKIFEKSNTMNEFCIKTIKFLTEFEKKNKKYKVIPPKIIYTYPKNNIKNTNIKNIIVKFDTNMQTNSWTVVSEYKEISYKNAYWKNQKEFHIRINKPLKKNKIYKIYLNNENYLGFMNYRGIPLKPFILTFKTL